MKDRPSYFVTGATGLIGARLVQNLLARPGTIYALVRPSSAPRLAELADRLDAGGRLVPVIGDLRSPRLGVELPGVRIGHMFHVAAAYDMEVEPEVAHLVNVRGTEHAVEFANAASVGTFHHTSSNGVAGRYKGLFTESMLDEGQVVDHPYFRSKLLAEKMVRAKCEVPFRIYRPGITVGDSGTGWVNKADGAYFFFDAIAKLARWVPDWVPLVGPKGGLAHIVPVDFVAAALDHIAHLPADQLLGDTFHLLDPNPVSVGEAINEIARAAGAPRFQVLLDLDVTRPAGRIMRLLPGGGQARDAVLRKIGIPPVVMDWRDFDAAFDTRNTDHALAGSGISCPPFADYAERIYSYWCAAFGSKPIDSAPIDSALRSAVAGRTVLVTGASSGIGRELSLMLGRAGATVLLLARRQAALEQVRSEIADAGGSASTHPADLASPPDVERVTKEILAAYGGVDIIVNNAGRSIRRPVSAAYDRMHDYRRTMDVNYFGPVQLTLALLPALSRTGRGHVLNVSSIGLQAHMARFTAYNASKAAFDAFSRSLTSEVHPAGVRLTTVFMPLVRSPMSAPTKAFNQLPALTPAQAAEFICRAIVHQPTRQSTALGTVAEVMAVLTPRVLGAITRFEYRLLADTELPRTSGQAAGPPGATTASSEPVACSPGQWQPRSP